MVVVEVVVVEVVVVVVIGSPKSVEREILPSASLLMFANAILIIFFF